MRNPTEEYLKSPDPKIGGATIPLVGPPGVGKTVALTRIGQKHIAQNHIVMFRGTQEAQWLNFCANDIPVTVWNHEKIQGFKSVVTGNKQAGEQEKEIDLTEKEDVRIKSWGDEDELVDSLDGGRVNVINVPGLHSDEDEDVYFFRKTWVNIFDALIDRDFGDFVTFLLDEAGDIFPSQQVIRKPFYKIVRSLPPKLAQLRKNNVFLFPAAHGTHDMHYFLWKIKSNSIAYMSGAIVKNELSPAVDQGIVNKLKRGSVVMPGPDKEHFKMPKIIDDIDWIPENVERRVRLKWSFEGLPDWVSEDDEDDKVEKYRKKAAKLREEKRKQRNTFAYWLYNNSDFSMRDLTDLPIFDVNHTVFTSMSSEFKQDEKFEFDKRLVRQ